MNYLLLSDIKCNGKIIKKGTITDLKQLNQKEIPSFIEAEVIAEFTNEILVEETIKKVNEKKVEKEVEKEEIKDIKKDLGIDMVKSKSFDDMPKKRGRPKTV